MQVQEPKAAGHRPLLSYVWYSSELGGKWGGLSSATFLGRSSKLGGKWGAGATGGRITCWVSMPAPGDFFKAVPYCQPNTKP